MTRLISGIMDLASLEPLWVEEEKQVNFAALRLARSCKQQTIALSKACNVNNRINYCYFIPSSNSTSTILGVGVTLLD